MNAARAASGIVAAEGAAGDAEEVEAEAAVEVDELGLDLAAPVRVDAGALVRPLPRLALARGLAGPRGVLSGHDLDRIEIRSARARPLQADGEDLGDVVEAAFEAERGAVSVLVP